MKKNLFRLISLSLLLVLSAYSGAQQVQPLPVDPKVRYGKLDNGMTYYIRANKEPKQRADFYIAQNVGAILENDNQNGLAHFLEHMAFNGTKNFPGKGVINYLEKIGVKFGADINAHTSLDETVYNLSDVPTVRQGAIDSSLLILHDWSNFIALEDTAVDAQRGVIREEWRQGANAERRMMKESNKLIYQGSQYAIRDVIGDTAIINNFAHKTIREFYKKWYRPDLQAILIVGDIDVDKVEAEIKTLFNDIPKKENAGERPIYPIPDNQKPIIAVVKDKEARMTRINLEYKHKKLPDEVKLSMRGYAYNTLNSLIATMIGNRFQEITQQADAPIVRGLGVYGELVKSTDVFYMSASPKEGQELHGLNALLLEAEKIKRFGFTNSELERAKTDYSKNIEKAYNERDNQKNSDLVGEYVDNFLNQNPIPGIEWEYQTVQGMLPQLKLEMINQVAKSYVTDTNMIVAIMAPDKEAVKIPTEDQIRAAIENSKKAELKQKVEETIHKPLIEKAPVAGKIAKTTENKSLGTTEWTLSNGIKVVFKPTTFKKDEILLTAFSEGGFSKIANPADLLSANLASIIVAKNGLGNFTQIDLDKILTGKIANVSPYITEYEQGFSGNSSVSDFETLLQLVYLNFTATRKDDNAYKAFINLVRANLANSASNPRKAFSDSVNLTKSDHHPRTVILNLNNIDKIDQDKALAIFAQRFAIPSNFTFIFTGNLDLNNETVKKAVCTYLGGLKSKSEKEKFTDNKIRNPKGKVNNYFTKEMKIKQASNFILYSGSMPFNMINQTAMTAIGNILSIRYTESVREKAGGSYGVYVAGGNANIPVDESTIMIQFDTDPLKQTKLMSIIHSEITDIVTKGPRTDDLQKVKENMIKKYTEDLAENNWWNGALNLFYQDHLNLVTDYKASVDALTPELIQSTLKSLVSQGNVMEVVMKPAE